MFNIKKITLVTLVLFTLYLVSSFFILRTPVQNIATSILICFIVSFYITVTYDLIKTQMSLFLSHNIVVNAVFKSCESAVTRSTWGGVTGMSHSYGYKLNFETEGGQKLSFVISPMDSDHIPRQGTSGILTYRQVNNAMQFVYFKSLNNL